MTALSNPVSFNNVSGGSDTAASGSGSGAVRSGTGASTNNTTTVDLSADTPDLSVVSAGDLLWVGSSSGRQFSVISSVDDGTDTVTCDDVFTQTESGRNWGIGGKRATVDNSDSRQLFLDAKAGWIIELEESGTAYALTSTVDLASSADGDSTDGPIVVRGDTPGTRTEIQGSMNAVHFDNCQIGWRWQSLKFTTSNVTNTATAGVTGEVNAGTVVWINCEADGLQNGITWTNFTGSVTCHHCLFKNLNDYAILRVGGNFASGVVITHSHFVNCQGAIDYGAGTGPNVLCLLSNVFDDFSNNVITGTGSAGGTGGILIALGNMFNDTSSGDLIDVNMANGSSIIARNVFANGAGWGIDWTDEEFAFSGGDLVHDWNAFYSMTSGDYSGTGSAGANDIALTADPFVNADNGDFNINTTSGGGQDLRDASINLPT